MRVRSFVFSAVFGLAVLAVALPLRAIVAEIISTNIYIVGADDAQEEDVYVASNSARIDGIINGDLIISTGSLDISGTVTGDVFVISHGPVQVTGEIGGSLRGIARSVLVDGTVGDDVTVVAATTQIGGTVGRDALVFAGLLEMDGEVRRDVNGRMISAQFNGKVGHDVDIAVSNLTLDGATVVDGDFLYRSGSDASVAATAEVASQFERLPTRGSWGTELILTLATIVGALGFIFAGIVILWLFRRTAPRSVQAIIARPLRAALVGVAALIVIPVLIVTLMMTLVGVPVALALLLLFLLVLFLGPIPAVTAVGEKLLRGRWGLFAAFAVGTALWRIGIWVLPFLGVALYLGALVVGVGGWVVATWEQRRETPLEAALLPAAKPVPTPETIPSPVGWEAPLAPGTHKAEAEEGESANESEPEDR